MPKRSRKKPLKRSLLVHHRHTGKFLPRQHTSYPLVALLLVLFGVFLGGLTMRTYADPTDPISHDFTVNASVKGDPPTTSAVIASPLDGSSTAAVPITVNGTCEAGAMIKVYRNNVFSAAVLCAVDSTFSLQSDLFEGVNTLVARSFNTVDDEGPASAPVSITYNAPPPPAPATGSGGASQAAGSSTTPSKAAVNTDTPVKPLIKAENDYKGFGVGETVEWQVEIVGGAGPYAVSVDWGDGQKQLISRAGQGAFTISHVYTKVGGYKGSVPIKVSLSDTNGETAFIQLMVIITDKNPVSSMLNLGGTNATPEKKSIMSSLLLSWSTYSVAAVVVFSFWLGELRQLDLLRKGVKRPKLPGTRLRPRH